MNKRQSVGEAGPLSLYAGGFREHLEGKGYATDSVRWRLRQLTALDRWLRDQHLAADDLDADCVNRLVAVRRAEHRTTLVAVANFSVPIWYLRESVLCPCALSDPGRLSPEAEDTALLTAREMDVLRCLMNGRSRNEVGALLQISPNTVRTHIQSILHKLKVHSTLMAVTFARRAGQD